MSVRNRKAAKSCRPHVEVLQRLLTRPAGRLRSCLVVGSLLVLPLDVKAFNWWPWGGAPAPEDPLPLNVTILVGEEAGQEWLDGSLWEAEFTASGEERRSHGIPPRWDSSECMERWGVPELQSEVDPRGYLIFSEGREQLGNNRFLLSDGLVIAKALNRTLVEFPMEHSRVAMANAELGLCDYWDCARLCSYHRILDLWTFRAMLRDETIQADNFLTVLSADREQSLMPSLVTAGNITDFFDEYETWQVIVMKMAWKSGLRREPVDLLKPNPFYFELVERLVEAQKGWENGQFMAVQWRTETSTGNLTQCYERYVQPAVEEQRLELGFRREQVYFNTDLVGQASTTYNASVVFANRGVVEGIRKDYPAGMDNAVYDYLEAVEDAGATAMVSGLVSASASFLLSSSFNVSGDNQCQKPHSKYIDIIVEWRLDVLGQDTLSIGQIFPGLGEEQQISRVVGRVLLAAGWVGSFVLVGVLARKAGVVGRAKRTKLP